MAERAFSLVARWFATLSSALSVACSPAPPPAPRVVTMNGAPNSVLFPPSEYQYVEPRRALVAAPYPWRPDKLDGTFKNPVLYADYSDPDAIRVGDDYYLVASSFQCTPGLPILHSKDLVNWTIVGYALENLPDPRYSEVRHGEGIWAPAIREHAGKFYIFAPTPDEGIYVLTAPHPKGPWSKPKMLAAGKGLIDPCPLWDDDGRAYLVHAYARSRAGIRDRLRVRPMAPDASALLGEGRIVFMQPERQPTIEGPKFYKKDGWYYILAPAGGVPTGWQVALRSRDVYGPYEDRIVLAQRYSLVNGPHQGALVDTPNGEWWFLHFQDVSLYGRVVHLNRVTWDDGWPYMGGYSRDRQDGVPFPGQPMPGDKKPVGATSEVEEPQTSDEFDSPELGLQWQWHANHVESWYSLTAKRGWLRLFPQAMAGNDFSRAPNLLLQKLPATSFVVETVVRPMGMVDGSRVGIIVMGESHAALAVSEAAGKLRVTLTVDKVEVERSEPLEGPVLLRVLMKDGGLSNFDYGGKGERQAFNHEFQAKPGRWIGAKVGLFAVAPEGKKPLGYADFEAFRFRAPTTAPLVNLIPTDFGPPEPRSRCRCEPNDSLCPCL